MRVVAAPRAGIAMPAQAKGKKSKKTVENIAQRLALVMKSGKSTLGYKQSMKQLRQARTKLVILANNIAPLRKSEVEYYCQVCLRVCMCVCARARCAVCGVRWRVARACARAEKNRRVSCCVH